jgi:hypothetical protein
MLRAARSLNLASSAKGEPHEAHLPIGRRFVVLGEGCGEFPDAMRYGDQLRRRSYRAGADCSLRNSGLPQTMGQDNHTRTAAGTEIRGEMP